MQIRRKAIRPRGRGAAHERIKQAVYKALRQAFPNDTVDVSDGYRDNLHVLVVSRRFDEMSEDEKQQYLWRIIDAAKLPESEKRRISLVYPISPAEIR